MSSDSLPCSPLSFQLGDFFSNHLSHLERVSLPKYLGYLHIGDCCHLGGLCVTLYILPYIYPHKSPSLVSYHPFLLDENKPVIAIYRELPICYQLKTYCVDQGIILRKQAKIFLNSREGGLCDLFYLLNYPQTFLVGHEKSRKKIRV